MNPLWFLAAIAALTASIAANAEPLPVAVYVISKDAKFIGDSMGGAEVVIRDVSSGKVLAKGITKGGTGDTDRIMRSNGRSPLRTSTDAAHFAAVVDIDEPRLVRLEVKGPLGKPASAIRASAERWLVPGQRLDSGEGWTIELPGLVVDFISAQQVPVHAGKTFALEAKISLLCGCPITPGGMWDAADYEVDALFYRGTQLMARTPLAFSQAPGGYAGSIAIKDAGNYRLVIAARNIRSGNSGLIENKLRVLKATPDR